MSKGSRRRASQVSESQVQSNWDRIFGKKTLHGNDKKDSERTPNQEKGEKQ